MNQYLVVVGVFGALGVLLVTFCVGFLVGYHNVIKSPLRASPASLSNNASMTYAYKLRDAESDRSLKALPLLDYMCVIHSKGSGKTAPKPSRL